MPRWIASSGRSSSSTSALDARRAARRAAGDVAAVADLERQADRDPGAQVDDRRSRRGQLGGRARARSRASTRSPSSRSASPAIHHSSGCVVDRLVRAGEPVARRVERRSRVGVDERPQRRRSKSTRRTLTSRVDLCLTDHATSTARGTTREALVSNDSVVVDHPERLGDLADGVRPSPDRLRRRRERPARARAARLGRRRRRRHRRRSFARRARRPSPSTTSSRPRRSASAGSRAAASSPSTVAERADVAVHGERRCSVAPVQAALDQLRGAGARRRAQPRRARQPGREGRAGRRRGALRRRDDLHGRARSTPRSARCCSTTSDPAPQPAWLPQPLGLAGHTPPRILVLDTGLRTDGGGGVAVEHPYLTCARLHSPWLRTGPNTIDDEDEFDDDRSGTLDFEAGHGTFITGVIQQICPDAEVHIAGVLSSFGDGDVANVIAAFQLAVEQVGEFDIVVMSLGGYMSDDDGVLFGDGHPAPARRRAVRRRRRQPVDVAALLPGRAARRRRRRWARPGGQGLVHELRRLGRCMCTGHRRGQHVLPGDERRQARTSRRSPAGPAGAARASRRRRSPPRWPRRCTSADPTPSTSWKRLSDHRRYRFPDLGIVFNV